MNPQLEQQISDFKPKIKTLTGQEHLEIQSSNAYRKLAWYAFYIDSLEDYRQNLIRQKKYEDKHRQAIDSEIQEIQADYDELYEQLCVKLLSKP
jgi:ferritin